MNLEIRKIEENEWEFYKRIRLESLKEEPIAFGRSFEEETIFTEETWRARSRDVVLAFDDKKPVGLMAFIISNRVRTQHIATIYSVYVNKAYRGNKIGKKLLNFVLEEIKKNKQVRKVNLSVNPELKPAVTLYKNAGFNPVGTLHKEALIDGKYYDQLFMELFL
ncbi:MAG: GNAT family N-acetyltransferase [Promethearchaeota archaeon]